MKLCLDCGAITNGAARCPAHRRQRDRARNSASFYTTREWRRLRAQCIARDGASLLSGSTFRLTAHHVIPREHGGPDALDNLVTLADPEGDHDWVIEAEADLDASDAVGELILRGTALRRL